MCVFFDQKNFRLNTKQNCANGYRMCLLFCCTQDKWQTGCHLYSAYLPQVLKALDAVMSFIYWRRSIKTNEGFSILLKDHSTWSQWPGIEPSTSGLRNDHSATEPLVLNKCSVPVHHYDDHLCIMNQLTENCLKLEAKLLFPVFSCFMDTQIEIYTMECRILSLLVQPLRKHIVHNKDTENSLLAILSLF